MFGAILGDIIGSPYERYGGWKRKEFPLFIPASVYTDDSVMTLAVADALMDITPESEDQEILARITGMLRWYGRRYPGAGYGGKFRQWLRTPYPKPYGSYGNGSAMRVSAVGWLFADLDTVRRMAALSAKVTHNHPEGIKGAEATAAAVYLARTGSSKEKIRDYIQRTFGYDLTRTCDEIRPTYRFDPSCQGTVPQAIRAFLDGENFEDVIRTAISLGGDADTLGAIAGAIAEAYYGVSEEMKQQAYLRLPEDLAEVLRRFEKRMRR